MKRTFFQIHGGDLVRRCSQYKLLQAAIVGQEQRFQILILLVCESFLVTPRLSCSCWLQSDGRRYIIVPFLVPATLGGSGHTIVYCPNNIAVPSVL